MLIVGSPTETLAPLQLSMTAALSYLTPEREAIALVDSMAIVAGHTLTQGDTAAVTVDGIPTSLSSPVLIVGSKTTTLSLRLVPGMDIPF